MSRENLEEYTYEYLMQMALSFVPEDRDKREGSVIYDALAPFCQVLAAGVQQLKEFYTQTYAITATGADLDNRVAEQGISRYGATYAVKKVILEDSEGQPVTVPLGSRFSTVSDTNPVNYVITAPFKEGGVVVPGSYEATCEELGVIGNEYSGNLINITFIQGLAAATMSTTLVPARDEETDEELRTRYFEALNQKSFGGNISDYRTKVEAISGVGGVQIYPVWGGGGTVKLSIVDPTYSPCSSEFVASVQDKIDPENSEGDSGVGLGIAPIGHKVTVVTPSEVSIDISATVTLQPGHTLSQVQGPIKDALKEYIQSLREDWDHADDMNRYFCSVLVARVSSAIISAAGVINVTNVKLNGAAADIELTESGLTQQLPVLGEVTLNV